MKRPSTVCQCGRRTWTKYGICGDCAEDLSVPDGDSPGVLTGHWVSDGLVRRYVE